MGSGLMFLDCPAYLDRDGAGRCGLPAEVRCRFVMESTGGPLDSAMIRCPAGHWLTGAIESLTVTTGPGRAAAPAVPGRKRRRATGVAAMLTGRAQTGIPWPGTAGRSCPVVPVRASRRAPMTRPVTIS